MNNIVYTSKQKQYQFSSKNPSATKNIPLSNVYYMDFFLNFLFHYSFIDIVKLKITRINEMWCRILKTEDLSKKVRKTQDRTSLKSKVCRKTMRRKTYFLLVIPFCTLAVKNSSLKKSKEPRNTTLALFLAWRAATSSVFLPTAWGYWNQRKKMLLIKFQFQFTNHYSNGKLNIINLWLWNVRLLLSYKGKVLC